MASLGTIGPDLGDADRQTDGHTQLFHVFATLSTQQSRSTLLVPNKEKSQKLNDFDWSNFFAVGRVVFVG